jgi:EAL domain-containing protein (putative c-di-GMP-specific phosphodiesterase class I)/GGDEF domain-containing protein
MLHAGLTRYVGGKPRPHPAGTELADIGERVEQARWIIMSAGNINSGSALAQNVRFAFQPLINVQIGTIVAVEALARPAQSTVQELFRKAAKQRTLTELDVHLAVSAVTTAAEYDCLLPLHLNLFGGTVTHDFARLDELHLRLHDLGRRPNEVVLEIGPPFARLDPEQLAGGVHKLRAMGYRIAIDGAGKGDVPLSLFTDLDANMIKLDRDVVIGVPADTGRAALLEALQHLCAAIGSELVAEGVEDMRQLHVLRHNGVRLVQGNLLAPAARRPPTKLSIPTFDAEITDPHGLPVTPPIGGPRVTDFLSPATTLPTDVTADKVRGVFADHPEISGVVLVDDLNRPRWTIDRNRFLLAVTGPYGHALHANRPASRLADAPRLVTTATTAMEALGTLTGSDQARMYDDAIVVDESGRCLGAVRASHLIRGMAELKVEEAVALNPLTRLPGSDAIARDVAQRISAGDVFAVSWLDIDGFKDVNDTAGFSAGDDLIRSLGRSLTDAAAALPSVQVGHLGGDDFLSVSAVEDLASLSEMVLVPARAAAGLAVTVSLATLVCTPSTVSTYQEVSNRLAPLKRRAKQLRGTSWVLGRPDTDQVDILRGGETDQPPEPHADEPADT